jgi:hypothetical protein
VKVDTYYYLYKPPLYMRYFSFSIYRTKVLQTPFLKLLTSSSGPRRAPILHGLVLQTGSNTIYNGLEKKRNHIYASPKKTS